MSPTSPAEFEGRVIAITGASQGQGAAEARALGRLGAQVVICDILDDEGRRLAREIEDAGGKAAFLHLDVSSEDQWGVVMALLEDRFGRLDGLVNNAAIPFRVPLLDTPLDKWNQVLSVDLTGPFLGSKAAHGLMKRTGGSIVNIGSTAGMTGHFTAAYSAAKWGLRGLTKHSAMVLAADKIRVNAVHPNIVVTPMVTNEPTFLNAVSARTPWGEAATPEDISHVVVFLLSDASTFMTGTDLVVDGGFSQLSAYDAVRNDAYGD